MDNESLETGMGLENLHFPLDTVGNITTDGSLLSGLTTVGIGEDASAADPNFTDDVMMGNSGLELASYIPQTCMDATSTLPSLTTDLFQSSSLSHVNPILTTQDPLCGIGTPRSQTPISGGHMMSFSDNTGSFQNGNDGINGNMQMSTGGSFHQLFPNSMHINQTNMANGKHLVTLQGGSNLHASTNLRQPLEMPGPSDSITLRLPLATAVNKSVQLRLVTTGQNQMPNNPPSKVIDQKPRTNAMLFRDKVTGKHFIVPTGTTNAGLTTKTASNMFPQMINQQTQNIPSNSTVSNAVTHMNTQQHINNDISGTKTNILPLSNHGANIEIANSNINFDVNDFLNIPPKEQVLNNEGSRNNTTVTKDFNQTSHSDSQMATAVSTSVNSQPPNTEVVDTNKSVTERQDIIAEQPSNTPVHSYQTRSKIPKNQDSVSSQNEDRLSVDHENKTVSNTTTASTLDFASAKTGEDLIKMMCMARNKTISKLPPPVKSTPKSPPEKGPEESPPIAPATSPIPPERDGSPKSNTDDIHEMLPMAIEPTTNQDNNDTIYENDTHVGDQLENKEPLQQKSEERTLGSSIDSANNHGNGTMVAKKDKAMDDKVAEDNLAQNGGAIVQTERRIANLVPDSMKDFVRDIFEDEDALDKECIRHIMDDTTTVTTESGFTVGQQPKVSQPVSSVAITPIPMQLVPNANTEIKPLPNAPDYNIQIEDSQCIMVNGNKRWQCNLCPKMYSSKHNLVTHMLSHNNIKPHSCIVCGKSFLQQSHLQTHMLTHGNVKPHTCDVCDKSFTQPSHLKRHSAIHLDKKPYICQICDRGFAYPGELRAHQEKHANEATNNCRKCDIAFSSQKALKIHMSSVHSPKGDLRCKECHKEFVYPSQLRDHMLKHTGKRPFICGECGMDFMKEHHLKSHMFTHTGLRPWKCEICEKTFNQKANLQRHMLTHESAKYKCYICEKAFTQPQVLKSHMATHTGEKAFQCTECGKRFARRHNLKGHMALHGGAKKYVCFCGASFTLKGNLNRHQNLKHGGTTNPTSPTNHPPPSSSPTSNLLCGMPYDLDADDDIAAEAAAQILNEMSAKRLHPVSANTGSAVETAGGSGFDGFEGGGDSVGEGIRGDTLSANMISSGQAASTSPPFSGGFGGSFIGVDGEESLTGYNKQDGSATKKKRKSVPRKTKAVKVSDNKADSSIGDTANMNENGGSTSEGALRRTQQIDHNATTMSKSESDDSNLSPAKPRSARRKKTSVAKASRMNAEHDDVEQEWRRLADGDDVTNDDVTNDNQSNRAVGSRDFNKSNIDQSKSAFGTRDSSNLNIDQSHATDGSYDDADSAHALHDVRSELSSVWRDLRKLQQQKDGFENEATSGCQANMDAYEMEVDEEGRPKELVTITYTPQDPT